MSGSVAWPASSMRQKSKRAFGKLPAARQVVIMHRQEVTSENIVKLIYGRPPKFRLFYQI